MKNSGIVLSILAALTLLSSSHAQDHKYDFWDENYTVQALLGAVKYDKLKFDNTDGTTEPLETDLSTIPQLGGAWGTLPKGDRFQYGLVCSFLLGFKFDEVKYASAGGSGLTVVLSTSMWMFDFAGGGYINLCLTDNVRLYGAAGPLMVYADYRSEREETGAVTDETYKDSESAFGLGVYARTGIEFRIHEKGMLGLGVRGNWSNVDFSDVGGSSDISGIAGFVTYTAGL